MEPSTGPSWLKENTVDAFVNFCFQCYYGNQKKKKRKIRSSRIHLAAMFLKNRNFQFQKYIIVLTFIIH